MNDLLQSKKLLENKIALTKSDIERKTKEFDRLKKEAEEMNDIIITLNQELWQDEFALDAVNEEISRIPTLNCRKALAMLAFIFISLSSFAQDTIPARKVRIAEHVGISMKDGHVMYAHPRWRKVKSGFIIKESNGLYLINGKEYKPGNKKPLKIKK